jgi:hypothetical protein
MWKWAVVAAVVICAGAFSPSAAQQSELDKAERSADAIRQKQESEFWERRASVKRVEIWRRFRGNPPDDIGFNIDVETLIQRLAASGRNAVLINCDAYWSLSYDCEYSIASNGRRNTLLVSYSRSEGRKVLRVGVAYLNPGAMESLSEIISLLFEDPLRSQVLSHVRNQVDPRKEKEIFLPVDVRTDADPSGITLYISRIM